MAKFIIIYRIAKGYRNVTIWEGNPMTHSCIATSSLVPNKTMRRKDRYREIIKHLMGLGVPAPVYRPTLAERTVKAPVF